MNLVLSKRGKLHIAGNCRATGYSFHLEPGEVLLGFLMLAFNGLCYRKCCFG